MPTDIAGLHRLLLDKDELPAERGVAAIRDAFLSFKNTPLMGRLVENHAGLRELVINFDASGYLASHTVLILAIKHQREDDYQAPARGRLQVVAFDPRRLRHRLFALSKVFEAIKQFGLVVRSRRRDLAAAK